MNEYHDSDIVFSQYEKIAGKEKTQEAVKRLTAIVSISQAAVIANVHYRTMQRWVFEEKVCARLINGIWCIDRASLEDFIKYQVGYIQD